VPRGPARPLAPTAVSAAALAALAAAGGCGRSTGVPDEQLGGLVLADDPHAQPIDVARAARDPAELARALGRPYARAVSALGPHTARLAMTYAVTEGGQPISSLDDTTLIELGEGGAYRARYESSADYGREVIFLPAAPAAGEGAAAAAAAGGADAAGTLYLRPRYQRWHVRAPEEPAEPARIRDELFSGIGALWELLGPAAELTDRGAVQVAGRAGRRIEVRRAPSPAAPPPERLAQRKWREARTTEALSGEVVLDAESGAPLAAKLSGAVGFLREGRRFTLAVAVDAAISGIGTPATIAPPPPAEVVRTPERPREVDDRDQLLQGIAPPLRAGAQGAGARREATP
jgi:hypothetical protein